MKARRIRRILRRWLGLWSPCERAEAGVMRGLRDAAEWLDPLDSTNERCLAKESDGQRTPSGA